MSSSCARTGCTSHRGCSKLVACAGPRELLRPRGPTASCRAALLLALGAALAPGPGRAQEVATDGAAESQALAGQPAAIVLPEVEILTGPLEGSRRARAAQSTVIDAARFAREGRTVAEMLATSPGVSLRSAGGPLQATSVSLRGASPDQSLVLLDGIPLQGPGGGSIDLASVPSTLLSRVVVSRGVLGAQLGAGALGGAVELVPRPPGREGTEGSALLSGGSFGTAQLAAELSGRLGEAGGFTAALQLDQTAGDFGYARQLTPEIASAPFYADQRVNGDGRRGALLLRFEGHPSEATRLELLVNGSVGERGLPGPVGSFTPHARAADQGGLVGARLQGTLGSAVWTARVWGRGDRVVVDGLALGFSDCVPGTYGCAASEGHALGVRGEAELGAPLGEAHWLTGSVAAGEEWVVGDGSGRHRRPVSTAAVSDDWKLWSGRLELHPALRFDATGEERALSPGLSLSLRPSLAWPGLSLRAGVGRSFRAPSFSELYLDLGAVAPNPALRPEQATSVDAGVALTTERVTVSVGTFASWYQDLVIYELFPPARIKPLNVGLARMLGLEVQGTLQLPLGLLASLSYSYLDARSVRDSQTEGGQRLPYRPPHRLFARLAHQSERLEGFAELVATSETARNSFGTATLRAQAGLNAGAFLRTVGPLWVGLEARNVLDDRTQQDLFLYPLPGRQLTALARARF